MWWTAAAEPSSDPSQPIVVALISALGGVVAAAFAALVSIARRENRDEPRGTPSLGERTAVLEQRVGEGDVQRDVMDRRVDKGEKRTDQIEWFLDRKFPTWRP